MNCYAQSPADHREPKPLITPVSHIVDKDQKWNDMIPKYLPENVEIAHKTGSITGVHHDAAIVYLPNGKSYVLVLLSKNLKDFDQGTDQLAKISKSIYDYIKN